MSGYGRFCCKSLFALAIKISFGCTGDFHVNMWGTSSSEEKLAGDPGNVIEATSIGGRRSDFFTAGKLAPGNFGFLQHGVIPGSCHTKAHGISSPETYEATHSSGLEAMESNNGMLRGTGRVVEADIDLCGERDRIGRARRRS